MATATSSPPRRTAPPRRPAPQTATTGLRFGRPTSGGQRIGLYGPGGIGKTSLAAVAPGPVAFFDLDDSLGILGLDVQIVEGVETWEGLRSALQSDGWDDVRTIVIDTATKAEEMAVEWTIANIPHEKGSRVQRIEDYGFGKGYTHIYDTFMALLGDLDAHVRAGRNVVIVAHDCTATVPNPMGEDYIRYEPRLQSPNSGKASIRLRLREWLDHLLYVGYDIDAKDGKAAGSGTRTIYPNELPHCMAKSRTLDEPIPYDRNDAELWRRLFTDMKKETQNGNA